MRQLIKTSKFAIVFLVAALAGTFMTGCDYLGITPDISEYVETTQETIPDNESLKAYVEELKPLFGEYYKDGKTLSKLEVKGNAINVEIDLGSSTEPYGSFQELMVYETTRVSHSIYNYRKSYEAINDIYRINISFVGQKVVTLYGKQVSDMNGMKEFDSKTILDALRR